MLPRKLFVVGVGCTLAMGLSACGGGSDSGSKPASETKSMTFVSFGGAYQDAQKTAMTDPYAAANNITMNQDGPTDYAKIKAMVESGNVLWDVVDADPFFAIGNCDKYAEKLDFSVIDTSKMPKDFVSDCAVPSMTYSYVLMYNKEKYPNPPQNWRDFFDTTKFPGKRALQNAAQGGGYEAALLADGVPKDKLYPIDYGRAEKKLDSIKKDLVFWDSGAQSQQMMEKGETGSERTVGQCETGKPVVCRFMKLEPSTSEIESVKRRLPPVGIGAGVLDRQPHVGDAELSDHGAVAQLNHRVHD
jgi:putative spermidine/putrescine transport system substrate-binding protein